jgi:heptosyltransferase III
LSNSFNYKKILIYRIGHLGDTLVSLPAFWAIRKAFPEARLTLLTSVSRDNPNYIAADGVLPETGLFDEWLYYPKYASKAKNLKAFIKLFYDIRRRRFDCVFYLMTRNRTARQISRDISFFQKAGVKKIFGTEHLLKNLITRTDTKPLPEMNSETDFLLKSLPNGEFQFDLNSEPDLLLNVEEKIYAQNWLKTHCGEAFEDNRLLAVAPGSKWESKIWAEERFTAVVKKLIERNKVFPVVFGGAEDRAKGERLLKIWGRGANAAGQLNIRQAAAALEKCRLYLGNDTGTMHLAASVKTPCVAVFAAIDYAGRWHPYGNGHTVFRDKIACEGCYLSVCPFENQCLKNISAEEVLAACEKILAKT